MKKTVCVYCRSVSDGARLLLMLLMLLMLLLMMT